MQMIAVFVYSVCLIFCVPGVWSATRAADHRRLLLTNFDAHPFRKDTQIVEITNGKLQGTRDDRAEAFLGIPFALPPVMHRRFMRPVSVKNVRWEGVRNAKMTGPMCVQRSAFFHQTPVVGNEDCLYLNVYRPLPSGTPAMPPARLLPVMVFIPGGAFAIGSSYWLDGQFDGSQLAYDEEVIVVVMNYRLNILGFFSSPNLANVNDGSVGNLALQDQQEALRWVKREIKNFGGDPNRILLFGESAGGFSVVWHSVNENSRKEELFHSVITQSATMDLSWFFQSKQDAYNLYGAFADYLGCPTSGGFEQISCLQEIPSHFFLEAWYQWSLVVFESIEQPSMFRENHHPNAFPLLHLVCAFGPVIDGHQDGLMGTPADLIRDGIFYKVPMVAGITKSEGSFFGLVIPIIVASEHEPRTVDQWMEIAELIVQKPAAIRELYRLYPLRRIEGILGAQKWANEIIRDLCFGCSTEEMVIEWGKHAPAWLYLFSATLGPIGTTLGVGAMHSFDLHYVFKNFFPGASVALGDHEMEIAEDMSSRWASMARWGNPNRHPPQDPYRTNSLEWPEYSASGMIMEFGIPDTRTRFKALMDKASSWILGTPPSSPPSGLFNRFTASTDQWPSKKKCDFWERQRPLPWISHKAEKGFESRKQAIEYLEGLIEKYDLKMVPNEALLAAVSGAEDVGPLLPLSEDDEKMVELEKSAKSNDETTSVPAAVADTSPPVPSVSTNKQ